MKQNPESIQQWLIERIAGELEIEKTDIRIDEPVASFGIDSITMVQYSADLEDWLNISIDPAELYKFTTIEEISTYISELTLVDQN